MKSSLKDNFCFMNPQNTIDESGLDAEQLILDNSVRSECEHFSSLVNRLSKMREGDF